jgi:hypothetical protein
VEPLRVNVEDGAAILGISPHAALQKIRDGTLRSVVDGGDTLLNLTELRRYAAATDPVSEPLDDDVVARLARERAPASVTP